ncbi:MAG: hypothetical protein K2P93_02350 [Alphaproteobacteria bacterium]|nr:hypothetical protein [Alphaproteobacteria bacterium]
MKKIYVLLFPWLISSSLLSAVNIIEDDFPKTSTVKASSIEDDNGWAITQVSSSSTSSPLFVEYEIFLPDSNFTSNFSISPSS